MLTRRNLSHAAYLAQYQYVYLHAGLCLTTLSMNGVSDFVVWPRMRNFRVITARKSC